MTTTLHVLTTIAKIFSFAMASYTLAILIIMNSKGLNTPDDLEKWKDYMVATVVFIFGIIFLQLLGV